MKVSRISARVSIWIACCWVLLCLQVKLPAQAGPAESNLLAWGAGALVVEAPPSYADTGNWSPESLLDELPATGWANNSGDLTPKVFVFEMAEKSAITSLAFDTAQVENAGRGAKDVKMEIADSKDGAYTVIATPALAQLKDHQKFVLKTPATGRYLRLTVLNNYGDAKYMELMNVYAYGKPLGKRPLADNSGMFTSSYGNVGADARNQTLSEKPVGSNDTELGRSQNRRVEVVKK